MGDVFFAATFNLRSNFAVHHLRAAAQAARIAYNVEQANLTKEHGPWFDEMMLLVPVSVVMAGAALEAGANEVIQDVLDGFSGLSMTKGYKLLIADLKNDRTGNATEKRRRLSLLFDKVPDMGTTSWQDAKLLVDVFVQISCGRSSRVTLDCARRQDALSSANRLSARATNPI